MSRLFVTVKALAPVSAKPCILIRISQHSEEQQQAVDLQLLSGGYRAVGLVRSLWTELLPALTSIPPAGGGFLRLVYCNVPKG